MDFAPMIGQQPRSIMIDDIDWKVNFPTAEIKTEDTQPTNCSVHERCIWELSLEGAKANADTAIRKMWRLEERISSLSKSLEDLRNDFNNKVARIEELEAELKTRNANINSLEELIFSKAESNLKIINESCSLTRQVEILEEAVKKASNSTRPGGYDEFGEVLKRLSEIRVLK